MINVFSSLHIGSANHYETLVKGVPGWKVVHACKDPYHRQELGYPGRSAPKTHPEYLVAEREDRLILNIVDAPNPRFFPSGLFEAAMPFIHSAVSVDTPILVHCNQGESRAPSIGLMYLVGYTDVLPKETPDGAAEEFRKLYGSYNPGSGIWGNMCQNWHRVIEGWK